MSRKYPSCLNCHYWVHGTPHGELCARDRKVHTQVCEHHTREPGSDDDRETGAPTAEERWQQA